MSDNLTTSVTFAMTVNLGNFSSVKLGVTVEDHMQSIEEFESKFDFLYKKASNAVLEKLRTIKEKN